MILQEVWHDSDDKTPSTLLLQFFLDHGELYEVPTLLQGQPVIDYGLWLHLKDVVRGYDDLVLRLIAIGADKGICYEKMFYHLDIFNFYLAQKVVGLDLIPIFRLAHVDFGNLMQICV